MTFTYTENGTPYSVTCYDAFLDKEYECLYITNLQGDVVGIYDPEISSMVVSYTYDAWGRILSISGTSSDYAQLEMNNPLRYRGYCYDDETGFYYLQSRYYDPVVGRFLNADDDAYFGATGTLLSWNAFGYCENNAVNYSDYRGTDRIAIFYDNRISGLFFDFFKGFRTQAKHWIKAFEKYEDNVVYKYPYTKISDFPKKWKNAPKDFDIIIIISHGFEGGLSGKGNLYLSAINSLSKKKAKWVYLLSCNGATEYKGQSVATSLAFLTQATVLAVKDGKVSIDYFSGDATAKNGGYWVRVNYLGRGRYGDRYSIVNMNIKVISPLLESRC